MEFSFLIVTCVIFTIGIQTSHEDGLTIPSYCPYPWVRRTGTTHCYRIRTDKKRWTHARDACVAAGGYLATLKSSAENNFVKNRVPSTCGENRDVWFGLNDIQNNGQFRYSNGESKGAYTKWASSEPNNEYNGDSPADCVILRAKDNIWRDFRCSLLKCFACERSGLLTKVKEVWLAGPEGEGLRLVDGKSSTCVSMALPGESQRCEVSYVYVRISDPAATQVKVQLLSQTTAGVNMSAVPSCDTCGGVGIKVKMQQQRLVQGTSDAERFTGYYEVCEETGGDVWRCGCKEPPCDLIQLVVPPRLAYHTDLCEVHFPDY